MLKAATMFELSLALVAVLLGWWLDVAPLGDIRADSLADWIGQSILGMAAALPPLALLVTLCRSRSQAVLRASAWLRIQIGPLVFGAHWLDLATLSLAAGIGEEVLFRGLLQEWFDRLLQDRLAWPEAGAILAASVVFGLLHWVSFAYFAFATLMGCLLGLIYFQTGSLWTAIVLHAAYDFGALLWLRHFWSAQKEAT